MKKYGYCLICSVALLAIMLFGLKRTEIYTDPSYPLEFSLGQGVENASISIHESEDGIYYVFLPSYCEMSELKIELPEDVEASLSGTPLENGMNCSGFELEVPYSLCADNQYITDVYFYRSANVATMYVDTVTGNMDRIHRDKEYSEQASVMLYTAEGILDTSDASAYIKGRGNATWSYGKRPYQLTFSSAADLLGMGAASKWILLANAADATNLNNKLVLDMARQTGQGWYPENQFVDVYLNGQYAGLYLLTEKVEVGPSRLNLDLQAGDFLCKADINKRWTTLKNPVKTQSGRTIEISSPESLTNPSRENLVSAINQMEQIIMSGSDLSGIENFDLDSWVRKYLIDEISANIDADLVSSYFYFSDGVYYGGPLWDYDKAFGNDGRNISPTAFLAKSKYKSDSYVSHYYAALYANPPFYKRMVACYQSEFLPMLNQLTESGISDLAAEIQSAATMNYLRWQTMFGIIRSWNEDAVYTVDGLISYLEDRIAFLSSAWIDGVEYCTVQFEYTNGEPYWNFSVRKGEKLPDEYFDLRSTSWFDDATGCAFDFDQPILSDMILTKYVPNARRISTDLDSLKLYVIILSTILLMAFFFGLVCVDIRQRRKERRAANEPNTTRLSP